jgi:pimeloyl-ACP methyl ester carboxylesterase
MAFFYYCMMFSNNNPLLYYEQEYQPSSDAWLVLVHGAGGSSATWRLQRKALAKHFNLLLIDLPGHGKTPPLPNEAPVHSFDKIAERVWQVIDHLKLRAVHLVGTSLGSIICLQMRVLRPQQVASVVLAGAVVKLNTKLKFLVAICPSLAKLMGHKTFIRFGAHLILPLKNHKKSRDIFIRESHALGKAEFNRWMGLFSSLNQTLHTLFHHTSSIPHLLVSGSQDHLFLGPAKDYVHKHDNTEIEIFPNCGHVVTIERAKRFNRVCIEYLHKIVHAVV